MHIIFYGGSGLLGKNLLPLLKKHNKVFSPSHLDIDITKPIEPKEYDLIILAAAFTDVEGAETRKKECFDVNVLGVMNVLTAYPSTPIVYISTEYAKNPVNFYALTKRMGEDLVKTHPRYLIIRTLFKPKPWKYPRAFVDAYTQGDYVDVIAPLIEKEILNWDKQNRLVYIGTGRKTIYDLARQTRDVEPIMTDEVTGVKIPKDYI